MSASLQKHFDTEYDVFYCQQMLEGGLSNSCRYFSKTNQTKVAAIWVKKGQKAGCFAPDRLENHIPKGRQRRKRKSEEKKAMVALLVFTLEPLLWDTSIQRTQHLFREKCSHNLCTCYLYSLRSKRFQSSYCAKVRAGAKKKKGGRGRGMGEEGRDTSFWGKGHYF